MWSWMVSKCWLYLCSLTKIYARLVSPWMCLTCIIFSCTSSIISFSQIVLCLRLLYVVDLDQYMKSMFSVYTVAWCASEINNSNHLMLMRIRRRVDELLNIYIVGVDSSLCWNPWRMFWRFEVQWSGILKMIRIPDIYLDLKISSSIGRRSGLGLDWYWGHSLIPVNGVTLEGVTGNLRNYSNCPLDFI